MEALIPNSRMPCLVADSAAFIRNVDMRNLAEKVFTIKEVVSEIRDVNTKRSLAVLPYELEFREPSAESFKSVVEFSKKTGDYQSLSTVDLKVIALTYQLEKEFCDKEHIRTEPLRKNVIVSKSKVSSDKDISGFYIEKLEKHEEDEKESVVVEDEEMEGESKSDDENMEDDDGWITPRNISKVKEKMGVEDEEVLRRAHVKCACLTTDFAMQNVLIQMGLHVLSVHGMLIHNARNYILKCYGCYKETRNMESVFCPSCGNKTLLKVAVVVTEEGTIEYHYPKRRRNFNIRGTKFPIPAPKSGRHNNNTMVLCADANIKHDRLPKKREKVNPLDPDYASRASPFSLNDVNSRAFTLGVHVKHTKTRNPNENRRKKAGRKK